MCCLPLTPETGETGEGAFFLLSLPWEIQQVVGPLCGVEGWVWGAGVSEGQRGPSVSWEDR